MTEVQFAIDRFVLVQSHQIVFNLTVDFYFIVDGLDYKDHMISI